MEDEFFKKINKYKYLADEGNTSPETYSNLYKNISNYFAANYIVSTFYMLNILKGTCIFVC